jgi:hypothetical protein
MRIAAPGATGKPLQLAAVDAPGTTGPAPIDHQNTATAISATVTAPPKTTNIGNQRLSSMRA